MRARAPYQSRGVSKICVLGATSRHDGDAIGEIWYERPDNAAVDPSLLLKLLFTSQPLSIQVHPDDAFAHSMGLPNGKTEAWYVLSAAPEAKVALGLSRRLTPQQLREAIDDGSISDLDRVARGVGRRRHFRARRNDSRDWRGSRHCRTPTAERHDIPSVRSRSASVNFMSKTPSWWRTPDRPIFRCDRASLPPNGDFSFPTHTSYSNGSIWRQIPLGIWKRNERPGFSFSAAALSPDRSTLPRAMPCSRNRTVSTFTPAPPAWWASWRTRAAARFRTCCSVSREPGSIDVGRPQEMQVPTSLTQAKAAPKNGRLETIK